MRERVEGGVGVGGRGGSRYASISGVFVLGDQNGISTVESKHEYVCRSDVFECVWGCICAATHRAVSVQPGVGSGWHVLGNTT